MNIENKTTMNNNKTTMNNGFPFPLVKHGIFSALQRDSKDYTVMFLDGHNNPGFSGGPIIYVNAKTRKLTVAGVVSGYRYQDDNVTTRPKARVTSKNKTKRQSAEQEMIVRSNSGILIGYGIVNTIDAIKANPIGATIAQ